MKIEQGQIWEVITDSFFTTGKFNEVKRPVNLLKGEKIELRFPYAWHFRTEDNKYFHATEEMIKGNCICVGEIWEKVKWYNRISLFNILKFHLYDENLDKLLEG